MKSENANHLHICAVHVVNGHGRDSSINYIFDIVDKWVCSSVRINQQIFACEQNKTKRTMYELYKFILFKLFYDNACEYVLIRWCIMNVWHLFVQPNSSSVMKCLWVDWLSFGKYFREIFYTFNTYELIKKRRINAFIS